MAAAAPPEHPLCRWRLGGFRSISETTGFDLGGLNILVGANSAGKSSVLHSLLMVAQTLANPLVERPLVLNGHLVRLGLADDIVHEHDESRLAVGFELAPVAVPRPSRELQELGRLAVDARFLRTSGNDFGLAEVITSAEPRGEAPGGAAKLTARCRTEAEARTALQAEALDQATVSEWAKVALFSAEGDVPANTVGMRTQQFLPYDVLHVVNSHVRELLWLQWAATRYAQSQEAQIAGMPRLPLSAGTLETFRRYVAEEHGADDAVTIPLETDTTAAELLPGLSPNAMVAARSLAASPWLMQHREELPFHGAVEGEALPPLMKAGLEHARQWFAHSVVHLGPLRAAPQPLYELPLAASERSVGRNGEFTAAVLHAHADSWVQSPNPAGAGARRRHLSDAVNEWVSAMGLLSSVKARESGKLGFELHLAIEGVTRELDLTTVGVGVSQVLPIIVLGLITPPGSLLLFEQPELHLHPDVQASLGDFFLALARTGRQLIVETHSDYLINRLRRRAAADHDSDIPEQVRLFFFAREGASSSVTPARISRGGGMPGWPAGFLDTASREIEAVARAGHASAGT